MTPPKDIRRKPRPAKMNPSVETNEDDAARGDRLQKVLAAAGLGSRRSCEELILAGRVEVDREVVSTLGARVMPGQEVRVDGERLNRPKRVYYALHKPSGVISTNRDPSGRLRVIDLIDSNERLFAVGRLDKSSEGLILVTNDGDLAQRLTHPKFEVDKTYRVEVAGRVDDAALEKLRGGVHLAEGLARVAHVRIRKSYARSTDLEMVLKEGRNREVRRVLAAIGHKVERLTRIAIGPLRLGDLPAGAHRPLSREEVRQLEEAAGAPKRKGPSRKGAGGRRRTGANSKSQPPRSGRPASRQGGAAGFARSGNAKPPSIGPSADSLGTIIGGEVSRKPAPARQGGKRPGGKPLGYGGKGGGRGGKPGRPGGKPMARVKKPRGDRRGGKP